MEGNAPVVKKTKKNVKKTIITIVLCVFIVIVITSLVIIRNTGCFHYTYNFFFGDVSEDAVFNETYDNEITSIKVAVDRGNIVINNSKDEFIHVKIYSDLKNITLKNYNKKLTIVNDDKCDICIRSTLSNIVLEVPKTFDGVIDITNDYGNTKIEDLSLCNMYLSTKFGNLELKNGKNVYLDSRYGNNSIGQANILHMYERIGNISIGTVNKLELESLLSDIDINTINNSVYIDTSYGNVVIEKLNLAADSQINLVNGNVTINGETKYNVLSKLYKGKNSKGFDHSLNVNIKTGSLVIE